jgi:hypothetical protein
MKAYVLPPQDRSGLAVLVERLRKPVAGGKAELAVLRHQLAQAQHQLAAARIEAAELRAAAVERAHREDRLSRWTIAEIDNTAQWRCKMAQRSGPGRHVVRVAITNREIQIQDV